MAYSPKNPNGQATMANSEPIVLASDQSDVKVTLDGETVVLAAGTNNIGDVDVLTLPTLPAGDNNIGNVDVVTLPSIPAGTNNIGDVDVLTVPAPLSTTAGGTEATALRVTIANDSTGVVSIDDNGGSLTVDGTVTAAQATAANLKNEPAGNVAHDAADSGNPIKVGAKAASSLATATLVAANDRTDNVSDVDAALIVRNQFPLGDLLSERVSNTNGTSTAFSNFGATASTRSYITAIHVFRTDAGTTPIFVDFRDGTAGSVLFTVAVPPSGGAVLPAGAIPYFRTSANTALAYHVSAATTTVYISISGFKSKA